VGAGGWGRACCSLSEWCWCILCYELPWCGQHAVRRHFGVQFAVTANRRCGLLGKLVCSLAGTAPALPALQQAEGPHFTQLHAAVRLVGVVQKGLSSSENTVSEWVQLGDEWAKMQPPASASLVSMQSGVPNRQHSLLEQIAWQEWNCSCIWSLLFPLL